MALFNESTPLSQYADTPDLLPYATTLTNRNGKPTGIKKALDWLLPVAGGILGTVIAPGIGTKIGASLGSAATGALNRNERAKAEANGATDTLQNIDNSLAPSLLAGNVVNMASSMVNFKPGNPASIGADLQSVNPMADATGAFGEGAMQATGMTDYRSLLNNFNNTLAQAGQATSAANRNRFGGFRLFAEGGIPTPAPLGISTRSMDGRTRRRQERLADGLAERVDAELVNNQATLDQQQAQSFLDNYNLQRSIQAPAVRTEVNDPAAVEGNIDGANYIRNWLVGKGYGEATANVGTPQLLRPTDFLAATDHPEAAGVYVARRDQSYVMDDYNKATTRSYAAHETTHDAQDALFNNPEMQRSLGVLRSRVRSNSDPYLSDPQEIQARLMQMREGISQDPTKPFNRTKWRLDNILNTLTLGLANKAQNDAFREAKSVMGRSAVFDSLNDTFAEGGKPEEKDYKRYLAGDKTEDLLMIDKETGKLFGAMRYGERIFDQTATDTIDEMVQKLRKKPNEKDFSWLGKFVFDETLTHQDNQPIHAFQDGGRPKRTPGSTNVSNSYAQGMLAARAAADKKRLVELQAYADQYAATTNPVAKARLKPYVDELAALTQKTAQSASNPAKTQSPITSTQLNPAGLPANSTTRAATTASPTNKRKINEVQSVITPSSLVSTPATGTYTVQPGDTLNEIVAKTGGIRPDIMRWNGITDPNKIQAGQVLNLSDPRTAIATPNLITPNGESKFSPLLKNILPPANQTSIDKTTNQQSSPRSAGNYNWLNPNNVMNAARIVGGIAAANTPYPDEVSTQKFDWLVNDAEARQNDGLSPLARRLAIDNLADNRSTAYEALRRNAGGGASSGAVLAGLGQIGQTEVQGDVALGLADEQQRTANRMDYRGLLGAQMDIANQRFNRQFQAVQATRQAGLNLIPQGLQGITDNHQTWKAIEDPNSPYQRYFQSQINKENELAEAAKRIYSANVQTFLAKLPDLKPDSSKPRPPLLSAANPDPTPLPDYRTMFSVLPPALAAPISPYRPTFADGGKPTPTPRQYNPPGASSVATASSTATNRPYNPFQLQANAEANRAEAWLQSRPQLSTPHSAPAPMQRVYNLAQTYKEIEDKALDYADKATLASLIPTPATEVVGTAGALVGGGIRGARALRDMEQGNYGQAALTIGEAAAGGLLSKVVPSWSQQRAQQLAEVANRYPHLSVPAELLLRHEEELLKNNVPKHDIQRFIETRFADQSTKYNLDPEKAALMAPINRAVYSGDTVDKAFASRNPTDLSLFTPQENAQIGHYVGTTLPFNGRRADFQQRIGPYGYAENEKMRDLLNQAAQHNKLANDEKLYRGVKDFELPAGAWKDANGVLQTSPIRFSELPEGAAYQETGFLSTSTNPAMDWFKYDITPLNHVINAPANRQSFLQMNAVPFASVPKESEVLLPRNLWLQKAIREGKTEFDILNPYSLTGASAAGIASKNFVSGGPDNTKPAN